MKKIFVLLFLGILSYVTPVWAQTSLVATLSHDGEVSNFYGIDALVNAYDKAEAGDVITLSSGVFNPISKIEKALTIRGAGMGSFAVSEVEPTVVAKEIEINVAEENTSDNVGHHLLIEGINFTNKVTLSKLHNGLFQKCKFSQINYESGADCDDNIFIQCIVKYLWSTNSSGTHTFMNCIVAGEGTCSTSLVCKNTILFSYSTVNYSDYRNCILVGCYYTSPICTYNKNLWITNENINGLGVYDLKVSPTDEAIANLVGDYSDDKDYKLSEEAKKLITGSDGTEVGIYGGELPFDPTPSNPQITKFNVAKQTNAEGKLSVEIEVK